MVSEFKKVMVMAIPNVSFEFFPPKTPSGLHGLLQTADRLKVFDPEFASVTYGAGGSTQDTTDHAVRSLSASISLDVAPHLTCVEATREETLDIARKYVETGVRKIVALRGDPRDGIEGVYTPHPDGFAYASDLVEGLRTFPDLDIYVSAYPEKHPAAPSLDFDIDVLKQKQQNGATAAITQFFFSNDDYLRYRDTAYAAGVSLPLIPGIMVPENIEGVRRFASACGASVPDTLLARFAGLDDDAETRRLIARHFSIEQCEALVAEGVDQFHFYTLNKSESVYAVCHALGLRPSLSEAA